MISLQHTNDRRSRWQKSLRHEAAVAAAVGRRAAVRLGLILALSTDLVGAAEFKIGYLRAPDVKKTVSPRDVRADDNRMAGAKLAIADNNTTGRFLDQRFSLQEVRLEEGQDTAAAAALLRTSGVSVVIADLPGDDLLKAADANR